MAMQKTPGYETMTAVAQIANTHLLENAILNIQVTPKDDTKMYCYNYKQRNF